MSKVKRYSATNVKSNNMKSVNPKAEVYTYLLENKRDKVLALREQYNAAMTKATKQKTFTVTFPLEVDPYDLQVSWDDARQSEIFFDTGEMYTRINDKMRVFEQEINKHIRKITATYKEKLKRLYSDMVPSVSLDFQDFIELADTIFELKEFDAYYGKLMGMYFEKKTMAKNTKPATTKKKR
jgi:hypothetical protein